MLIYLMQFLSISKYKGLSLSNLNPGEISSLGHSDVHQGIFEFWKKILSEGFSFNSNNKFKEVLKEYQTSGEYEIISDGLFVNYLNFNKYSTLHDKENEGSDDANFNKNDLFYKLQVSEELEQLSEFCDLCSFSNRNKNNYDRYNLDYVLPGFKAAIYKDKKEGFKKKIEKNSLIEFPSILRTIKNDEAQLRKILTNIKSNYEKEENKIISDNQFLFDYLPYFLKFLIPNIRELNVNLLNKTEKQRLFLSVMTGIKLGLKIKITDNTIEFQPNILLLSLDSNTQNSLDYETYIRKISILSSEMDRIISLRSFHINASSIIESHIDNKKKDNFDFYYPETIDIHNKPEKKNFLMFQNKKRSLEEQENEYVFYIKYNEGLSNAVRRNISIEYFLN